MADKKLRRASTDLADMCVLVYGPPDDSGVQHVVETISLRPEDWAVRQREQAAAYGLAAIAANSYNRLDSPSAADVAEAVNRTIAAFVDGSWTPGRTITAGEPDDIVVALAEYYGVPVHVMQDDIDNRLERDENGEPVRDARGRNKRVFTQRVLDHIASEPQIRPIMARLAKERAERLAREAKAGSKAPTTGALDLFADKFARAAN